MLTPVPISVLFTDSDNRGFYHGTGSRSRSICFRSRVRHGEDRRERSTFGRIARWQHAATYLLYFVMLMNVFITTFGISGGKHDTVITVPRTEMVATPSTTSGGGHATGNGRRAVHHFRQWPRDRKLLPRRPRLPAAAVTRPR